MNRPFEPYFSSCDYSRWKGLKLQIKAGKKPLSVKYIFDKLTNGPENKCDKPGSHAKQKQTINLKIRLR